jgi:hypothetical protein
MKYLPLLITIILLASTTAQADQKDDLIFDLTLDLQQRLKGTKEYYTARAWEYRECKNNPTQGDDCSAELRDYHTAYIRLQEAKDTWDSAFNLLYPDPGIGGLR